MEEDMRKALEIVRRFRDEEDGAAMIEYTVLLGIITVGVIATVVIIGGYLENQWTALQNALTGAGWS
ncbi:Flp family type IVb pilin [Microbaculum marinisediminis]|uniref:Flp family type IVb pilin n=1 Tax=Microbaculum marinisediminis TaxID=2931392 RepID=A0AAW5R1F2_9HYPH|nr:Flp family type IVb pilin [Microbaculum sp. A6E488]MCT8972698.1 Flp family type IVb pilin [Microbaculum sp. A6E488]